MKKIMPLAFTAFLSLDLMGSVAVSRTAQSPAMRQAAQRMYGTAKQKKKAYQDYMRRVVGLDQHKKVNSQQAPAKNEITAQVEEKSKASVPVGESKIIDSSNKSEGFFTSILATLGVMLGYGHNRLTELQESNKISPDIMLSNGIGSNNPEWVKTALDQGADPNRYLVQAVQKDNIKPEIMNALLLAGADIHTPEIQNARDLAQLKRQKAMPWNEVPLEKSWYQWLMGIQPTEKMQDKAFEPYSSRVLKPTAANLARQEMRKKEKQQKLEEQERDNSYEQATGDYTGLGQAVVTAAPSISNLASFVPSDRNPFSTSEQAYKDIKDTASQAISYVKDNIPTLNEIKDSTLAAAEYFKDKAGLSDEAEQAYEDSFYMDY